MTNREAFAKAVKDERKRRGLTQAQLATSAGVSAPSVYRVEAAKAPDEGPAMQKIAEFLGLGTFLSGGTSTTRQTGATLPSPMAQMIGAMQLPAQAADPYLTVLEIATERGVAAEVFQALAMARREAPPGATSKWWFDRYLDAVAASSAPARDSSRPKR